MTRKRPALFRGRHFEDVIIPLCVRWYLRFSLTYRDLEEIMAERGLSIDHVTMWRWVQRYAPILNQRIRRELRRPNRSWRVDETYIKIAGNWAYLYRAVDSAGETIEFMLSPKRDLIAAKLFLRLALSAGGPSPRVINVDGHPAYPSAVAELKQSGELGRRCRCRTARYLNNVIEQDHGFIKKRVATLWLQRLHDWALWYCTVAPQPHRGCRSRASRDEGPHCPLGSFNGRVVSLESQPVAVSSVECRQAASSSGDRHPWPALYGGAGKHRLLLQCRMNCFRTFPNYIPDQS